MALPSWEKVQPLVEQAYSLKGRVERADCVDLAFATNAADEVVDALDAIGSRVLPNPQAVRDFLTKQGYIAP